MVNKISLNKLNKTLKPRLVHLDQNHTCGIRLINGFLEGIPELTVDLFGETILINDYQQPDGTEPFNYGEIMDFYSNELPWISSVLVKQRNNPDRKNQIGYSIKGEKPSRKILENGIWYALDFQLNQDASFYLDTRNLRTWLRQNSEGKKVLNTFAYTGSFGVAAKISGAEEVIQTDRNEKFLSMAKRSYQLNQLSCHPNELVSMDFFSMIGKFKRENRLFDIVILDPPFFSKTDLGKIDLITNYKWIINKIRPLIAHNGFLIAINNALFVSGHEYIELLNKLCQDAYLRIQEVISIPDDITGYPETITTKPIVDPSPFNYSTKIVILQVKRKDLRNS